MRPLPLLTAAILAAFVFSASAVRAERPDRDDRRAGDHPRARSRVTFYEHADFRGTSFTLEVPDQAVDLSRKRFANGARANDRISSIRIDGEAEVLVFQDAGYRGGVLRLTHSVRDLGQSNPGWNDAISSVRVEPQGRGPHDRDGR